MVTPLVEESEQMPPWRAWTKAYEGLANGELADFRLGLVHGRMSADEKQAAMDAFRSGQTQVLVATSVVEVGVDVPNATLMTIEGAERFGLAQLHQLRGRVSRGAYRRVIAACSPTPQTDDARASSKRSSNRPTVSNWPRSIFACAGRATCWAPASTACRRCASPICAATRPCWKKPGAMLRATGCSRPRTSRPEHAKLRRMALVRYGQVLDLGDVG